MRFKKNDTFTYDGKTVQILDFLGEGGQGEVYVVSCDGQQLAFKFYKEIPTPDFKFNLKNNISKGSPSADFLWPKAFVELDGGHCGYLMDIRPSNYVSFISYLTAKTKFKDLRTMLSWCIELVKSFKALHERGFSYQDLNDGSFFLDPNDGRLLICDNDNITADKRSLGVLGKMRYMAPEIVRGDKDKATGLRQMPDTHSDRFSLAVILFLALCMGNPFEGECLKKYPLMDDKAELEMFGTHPVYIYSKTDSSNRPIHGYHTAVLRRYPLLPAYIKEAFHKTFVDGLTDRENGRTTELEWIRLLCRFRDELISCSCGREFPYGFGERKPHSECPYCHAKTRRFCFLILGKHRVLLEPGTYLYRTHVDKYSAEYNTQVGQVIQNKNNPALWGIRLNLPNSILVKDVSGTEKVIQGDGVIPIINNLKVKFAADAIGQIKTNEDGK